MINFTYDIQLLFRIILLVWVISRVYRAIKYGKPLLWRELLLWMLLLYVAFLLYNTFEPFTILLNRQHQRANFVPLQGIAKMIENASIFDDEVTKRIVFLNLAGNVLIFSPFGVAIPLLEKRLNRGWLVVLLGLAISLVIELAQTFLIARVFDVDDLILNAAGTLIGFLMYALLNLNKSVRAFFDQIREAARPNALRYALLLLLIWAAATVGIYSYGYDLYRQIPQ
ncbi:MAG: VanZ family protein [Anaerolineaceae bacterium]|jgi:glycopeptide antibiotics resistance protein|nr:VanZ family protein [Anaerolineaceae bacterium]